jgi:hypothetical protein
MEADTDIMGMDFGRYFMDMDRDKDKGTIMVMVNTTETKENTRMKSNT